MNRTRGLLSVAVAFLAYGCELFVVGSSNTQIPAAERSQRTSVAVVYLWSAELDSSSTAAATELMLHSSGRPLLAIEKHDLSDELARWKRILQHKPITSVQVDTLSAASHTVNATYDYLRKVRFATIAVNGKWFISKVADVR